MSSAFVFSGFVSGAWRYVETKTAATSASLDFQLRNSGNGLHIFELQDLTNSTGGNQLFLRVSDDGGSTYDSGASDYDLSLFGLSDTGSAQNQTGTSTGVNICGSQNNSTTTGQGATGLVIVYNPGVNIETKIKVDICAGAQHTVMGHGRRVVAQQDDYIQFIAEGGNLAQGSVRYSYIATS